MNKKEIDDLDYHILKLKSKVDELEEKITYEESKEKKDRIRSKLAQVRNQYLLNLSVKRIISKETVH